MLAYSSIAHAGYALIGLVTATKDGGAALLFYLAVYGLMTLGAFTVLIACARRGESVEEYSDLAGLGFRHPVLGAAMTVFMLSLAGFPPTVRKTLRSQRDAIRTAAPGAVEVFSYGIPGFKLDGKPLAWYAGYKSHTSLYPMGEALQRQFADELQGCGFSKGTIRFPIEKPPSPALVKKLVKARIAQIRRKERV